MSRIKALSVVALGLAGSLSAAEAAPLPAQNAAGIAGGDAAIARVQYRRYGYRGGYGYRRGYGGRAAGALAAGAALGIIGGAVAASAAPRYYGYPAYGYGYPAYGYGYPAYGYPARGYYYDGY